MARNRSPKRRSTTKKSAARRRSPSKRSTTRRRSPVRRSAVRRRSPAKRSTRRKSPVRRRSPAKRSTRRKSPVRRRSPAKRSTRRKSPAKRSTTRRRRSPAKRSTRRKSPAKKSVTRKKSSKPLKLSSMRGGSMASVNPAFKKLYKMLKDVPLISIPTIPQFEQKTEAKKATQEVQKVQKVQDVQKVQEGGYKKGFKVKTQEDGTRKFVLSGYSYEKDINKSSPVVGQIAYELEDKNSFGRFDNIKPQDAAKKIYSRLCKKLRKDYGEAASSCINMLLHVQEQCCDNVTANNKPRDYYYYIQNTPNKRVITKKDGKTMNVYNNAKAIPIFAIRNRRNEIVRMQSVDEALAVANKKRNTSLAVYARRKSSGKKLLRNAKA